MYPEIFTLNVRIQREIAHVFGKAYRVCIRVIISIYAWIFVEKTHWVYKEVGTCISYSIPWGTFGIEILYFTQKITGPYLLVNIEFIIFFIFQDQKRKIFVPRKTCPVVFEKKILKSSHLIFAFSRLYPLWREQGSSFQQTWILLNWRQDWFVPSSTVSSGEKYENVKSLRLLRRQLQITKSFD